MRLRPPKQSPAIPQTSSDTSCRRTRRSALQEPRTLRVFAFTKQRPVVEHLNFLTRWFGQRASSRKRRTIRFRPQTVIIFVIQVINVLDNEVEDELPDLLFHSPAPSAWATGSGVGAVARTSSVFCTSWTPVELGAI